MIFNRTLYSALALVAFSTPALSDAGAPEFFLPSLLVQPDIDESKKDVKVFNGDHYEVFYSPLQTGFTINVLETRDMSFPEYDASGNVVVDPDPEAGAGIPDPEESLNPIQRRLNAQLRAELESRPNVRSVDSADLARLFDLAGGIAEREYGETSKLNALRFSNDTFDVTSVPESGGVDGGDAIANMQAFLATQEGLDALKGMTPSQIEAIMRLANPQTAQAQSAPPQVPVRDVQRELTGVPSLTFRPDLDLSPRDQPVSAGVARNEVRDVGDGQNMLLAGWNVRQVNSGVEMFKDGNSASNIGIAPGMVMGVLGEIQRIDVSDDEVFVMFEGGDILRERVSQNIPFKINTPD